MQLKQIITLFFILAFSFTQAQLQELRLEDTLSIDKSTITEKRTFNDNFKNNYSSREYQYELDSTNNGWFSRLKRNIKDFFTELFNISNDVQTDKYFKYTLRIIYFLIIATAIFIIVRAILNKEGNWIFGRYSDKKSLNIQDIEANIHNIDFKTLIENATKNENYRLAIRYYYLWLLKELSEKEYIVYDVEKTNSDYINELKTDNIKTKFSYTSYLYNYIWYGEFSIKKPAYTNASTHFENLLNTIKK